MRPHYPNKSDHILHQIDLQVTILIVANPLMRQIGHQLNQGEPDDGVLLKLKKRMKRFSPDSVLDLRIHHFPGHF